MIHRLIRLSALCCASLALPAALAQPAAEPALLAPRLVVAAPAEAPVALRGVRVRTEINARCALTEVTLTFYNPNARQLEGELQFPLQAGQTVVGMAMDVNGVMREAVPVEKARGEAVFEDVTRTRIDPALLSVTQGDNYKLRVYPLLPRSEKVVVLRIAEWLTPRAGRVAYRLPLDYGRLGQFSASVQVSGVAARPEVRARGFELPAFVATGGGHRLDLTLNERVLSGALPPAAASRRSVSTGIRTSPRNCRWRCRARRVRCRASSRWCGTRRPRAPGATTAASSRCSRPTSRRRARSRCGWCACAMRPSRRSAST